MSKQSRILVIDDDQFNRSLLMTNLRELGYAVDTAQSGPEALNMVQQMSYDAILLDLVMPGMEGVEVLARLKQDPTQQSIPVIVISSNQEIDSVVRCIELGATDYLTKPFNATILRARLTATLTAKYLHEEQEAHLESLQTHNAELDAFTHTVAHDLKTPLGALMAYATLLEKKGVIESQEERAKLTTKIVRLSRMMNGIIQELLLLAHIRKEDVQMGSVDMSACLGSVQQRLAWLIKDYQPTLAIPPAWPMALGYAPWVEEIWANYLSNAMKYGGGQPKIELGATVQPAGTIRFWVRDEGPGIALEQQALLFVPFTRLNQVRIEGQGLGLSIVQRIAEKMGGQVGVVSAPGAGSCFWFELPTIPP